jgi:hypothetical protein
MLVLRKVALLGLEATPPRRPRPRLPDRPDRAPPHRRPALRLRRRGGRPGSPSRRDRAGDAVGADRVVPPGTRARARSTSMCASSPTPKRR